MPLSKLLFRPGVNREGTSYANEGAYYACDKIRFRSGYPEKVGGWSRLSDEQFTGIARALINWVTLDGENVLGIGTSSKYMLEIGGTFSDITPLRSTTAAGEATFAATAGSSIVTVTDADHGAVDGDYVTFSATASLGGNITSTILNREYLLTYVGANSYTIDVVTTAAAGDTGSGGASTIAAYQLNRGLDVYVAGLGWGAGPWPRYTVITLTNPFDTHSNTQIDVNDTAHGLVTGAWVYFSTIGDATVGGVATTSWLQAFQITRDNDNLYHFTSGTAASSTVSGVGGTVVVFYAASGSTGYGDPSTQSVGNQLRVWTHDLFGEDLVYAVRGGGAYYYDYSTSGVSGRGVALSALSGATQAPTQVNIIMVSQRDRHVVALGCNMLDGSGAFDALQIRWSDAEDAADWAPIPTNSAGDLRISAGSQIMAAAQTKQETLIWTDSALYSMQYIGAPYTFGVNLLGANISIMSPNAVVIVNGVAYWMGLGKFFTYSGAVDTLPCTLRQYIFDDFSLTQAYQVFAGSIAAFNEVWWFYPADGSSTVDRYVVFNYLENVWYYGTLARTAWLDSSIRRYPMGADYNNRILYHENGVDDNSGTSAAAIDSYVESSDFDIGDGDSYAFIRRILPDLNFTGSTVSAPTVELTLSPRTGSGTAYRSQTAKTVTVSALSPTQLYTNQVDIRVRGRQMKIRVENNTVGTHWQLGAPRIDVRPDGKAS